MLLLQANNIQKSYGTRTVLDFDQLLVYEGDKIGIVGENGAGKSTLLGILSREIAPDRGVVSGSWQVAYIRQFDERDPTRSGGENAKQFIQAKTGDANEILFADEPTANLDTDGQKWVLQRLQQAKTLLLVSHDRALLDQVCTRIIAIRDGTLKEYTGNYSDYEASLAIERQQHELAYTQYRQKRAQLEAAVQAKQHKVSTMRERKKSDYRKNASEARLYIDARKAKQKKVEGQSVVLKARLERLEKVEKLRESPALRIDFSLTHPPGNRTVINCEKLHFSYGDKAIFEDASFAVANRTHVAVTGKNGAGKSTLLRLIHEGHESIVTVPKLRMGFLHQNFEELDLQRTVLDNVLLTSIQDHAAVRSVLAGLLFLGDDVYKPASALSGGERMRLSLAKLLTCEANTLLLDEPTNYLDLRAIEAVQDMIRQYPGTILFVSHDALFVEAVATTRLHLEGGKIAVCPIKEDPSRGPSSAQKTVLELRLTQLVSEISSAAPERKDQLEARYRETLEQLQKLTS